jgi:hypothetical protein
MRCCCRRRRRTERWSWNYGNAMGVRLASPRQISTVRARSDHGAPNTNQRAAPNGGQPNPAAGRRESGTMHHRPPTGRPGIQRAPDSDATGPPTGGARRPPWVCPQSSRQRLTCPTSSLVFCLNPPRHVDRGALKIGAKPARQRPPPPPSPNPPL